VHPDFEAEMWIKKRQCGVPAELPDPSIGISLVTSSMEMTLKRQELNVMIYS